MEASHLPPLHPPRLSSSCDRHPGQHVTGFCASCLRERLAGLETPQRKSTSSSSSTLKSIFLRPELRRCKSFSGIRADASSSGGPRAFEPQRKSCDVRGRNTLWSLFHQDDTGRVAAGAHQHPSSNEIDMDPKDAVFPPSVLEEEERDDEEIGPGAEEPVITADTSREIMEEEVKIIMNEHIDLEKLSPPPPIITTSKEPTGGNSSSSSFWLAASVFSKKLQKWRRKQKLKKSTATAQTEKTHRKPSRETQSEIAVDAFGRRSCDIDPRFSLDAGRMSVDGEPRFSWDVPRASWDGHLMSRSRIPPPMLLALGEDIQNPPVVERWDGRIPVEEEDSTVPGGSAHYVVDSSSSRRRSLDRSDSVRKQSFEFSELMNPASNARVSPAGGTELFHLHNGIRQHSLRDDCSESFESAFRDSQKGASKKKSKRWSKAWNIWGFIYRRGSSSRGGGGGNEVDRTFSEPWPELLREQMYNGNIFRSTSNASSTRTSSLRNNSGFGSTRRSTLETNGHGKKRRGEFVLERNRSARYSPNHIDNNGMLRFYLTPMRGSRRNGISGKSRHNNSYSITKDYAKNVLSH